MHVRIRYQQAEPPYQATQARPRATFQRERKHPTTTFGSLRGVIRDQSVISGGRAGMTTTPSIVGGCAESSVGGMTPQESGAMAWRHRFRRRRARLEPSRADTPPVALGHSTLHRAPVGQGLSGPDWLATALGFWWSGRALATGYWHGVGGFVFNSSSSVALGHQPMHQPNESEALLWHQKRKLSSTKRQKEKKPKRETRENSTGGLLLNNEDIEEHQGCRVFFLHHKA